MDVLNMALWSFSAAIQTKRRGSARLPHWDQACGRVLQPQLNLMLVDDLLPFTTQQLILVYRRARAFSSLFQTLPNHMRHGRLQRREREATISNDRDHQPPNKRPRLDCYLNESDNLTAPNVDVAKLFNRPCSNHQSSVMMT